MAKTQVLRYWIHLTDKALVDTLNTELDAGGGPTLTSQQWGSILVASGLSNGLVVAPFGGANITAGQVSDPVVASVPVLEQGTAMASPSLTSEWFTTSNNFPRDVATFLRASGGWFGIHVLFGTSTRFYWSGRFVFTPAGGIVTNPNTGVVIAAPASIPTRYFLETFELPQTGNGGSIGGTGRRSRDSSGFTDGYGLAMRRTTGAIVSHTTYEYLSGGIGAAPQSTWHRLYFTPRAFPVGGAQAIWWSQGTPTAGNGMAIGILPTGQLAFYIVDSSVGTTLAGTSATPLTLGQRVKIDLVTQWNTAAAAGGGAFSAYVGGVLVFSVTGMTTGPGAASGAGQREQTANLGQTLTGVAAAFDDAYEGDVDYWHCAAKPTTLDSVDWLNGSRGLLLEANGQASDFTGWTAGKYRSLSRRPAARSDSQLASTTALALASFTVDVLVRVRNVRQALGMASMVIGLNGFRGTLSGRLGYKLNGGADVYANITQGAGPTPAWNTALYPGPGSVLALVPTALDIKHEKGNDAVAGGIQTLAACVELIGIFGKEDLSPSAAASSIVPGFNPRAGVHNSHYPDTPWGGGSGAEPAFSPFAVFSGTYVGNGTTLDVALNAPPCFVAIRRVSGTGDLGAWWTTALLGAKVDIEQGTNPTVTCLRDSAYVGATALNERELQFLLRIGNSHAQVNTNGATYHYIAICDPGARFFFTCAFSHASNAAVLPKTNTLGIAGWTPSFALSFQELLDNTSTDGAFEKSASLTVDAVVAAVSSAETANAMTLGVGSFIERIGLNSTTFQQISHLLGRVDDGNGPHAIPPFAVVTYTGDGTASRTIGVNLGGKRPLWAFVNGNAGAYRDASHTTTNSTPVNTGTQDATHITGGGLDSVSVGATLNANGVPYVMFIVPGSATAGNGGWSIDGDFWPIEPDSPRPPGGWVEPIVLTPTTSGSTPTLVDEPDFDGTTDLPDTSLVCVDFSQRIVNRALSRIGVSKQITALATATSIEAVTARLHLKDDVEQVLRDFDWPFATRYADLVLVAGTETVPANTDWQYSYRAPTTMIKARRVVSQDDLRRAYNPTPVTFRVGSDAGGALIYTNAAVTDDVPVQLEYTIRMSCPAYQGDALFRDALTWKHAASLAMALSRDEKRQQFCLIAYKDALIKAKVPAAAEQQTEKDGDAGWISGRG